MKIHHAQLVIYRNKIILLPVLVITLFIMGCNIPSHNYGAYVDVSIIEQQKDNYTLKIILGNDGDIDYRFTKISIRSCQKNGICTLEEEMNAQGDIPTWATLIYTVPTTVDQSIEYWDYILDGYYINGRQEQIQDRVYFEERKNEENH